MRHKFHLVGWDKVCFPLLMVSWGLGKLLPLIKLYRVCSCGVMGLRRQDYGGV